MVNDRALLAKTLLLDWVLLKDISAAKRKLDEGVRSLLRGDAKEAFEDFAAVKYYLMDEDCYTETLISVLDDLLDMAWGVMRGSREKPSKQSVSEKVKRLERLMANPKGEPARPPVRVKTVRDARLWEAAKRIVSDNYKNVEEESERYWQIVSRIFTRMKLRLGGLDEKKVEEIVQELQEKEGKLPAAGEGSKAAKLVERMKERAKGGKT